MADCDLTAPKRCSACEKCGTCERYASGKCKHCTREQCRAYYIANKEAMNAASAKWRADNPEKANSNSREWAANNREKSRAIKAKWAENNPEKVKTKAKAYYAANSVAIIAAAKEWDKRNRKRANATGSAWRAKNAERHKAACAAWRNDNRDRYLATAARWRRRNPEAVRMSGHARRMLGKRAAIMAKGIIKTLRNLQRGLCPCCKRPLGDDFHVDHIIPVARGGSGSIENLQLMRAKCNQQKSSKDPIDFMRSRGFLL